MIHVRGLTNSNKFVKLTQMFLFIRNVSIIFEKKFRDNIKPRFFEQWKLYKNSENSLFEVSLARRMSYHEETMTNTFISTPLSIEIFNSDFLICFFTAKIKEKSFDKYVLLIYIIFILNLFSINLFNNEKPGESAIQTRES